MSSKTTLLVTPSARLGRKIAEGMSELGEGGLLLAPRGTKGAVLLPNGWAHLGGESFDPETILANVRTTDNVIILFEMTTGERTDELSLLSEIAQSLEKTQGTLVLARELPLELSSSDDQNQQRRDALVRRTEDMLLERSISGGFNLSVLALPHTYGPGVINGGLSQRLSAAASGEPYTWPGKPTHQPRLMHVDDAAKHLVAAFKKATRGGERLWVSGEPEVTMESLAQLVAEITGGRSRVSWPDVSFMESLLGKYKNAGKRTSPFGKIPPGIEFAPQVGPRTPLGEGLRETLLLLSKGGD